MAAEAPMISLGAQYYRPPFPEDRCWEDDLGRMAASGLNTVQLWILWGWVEPEPGRFVFEDYDRLVEIAGRKGLKVVLSAISEIQPVWIHRVVPGCELVTNTGERVVSSNRGECHFGLTPGGCFDHPRVWEMMVRFFTETATRYRGVPHLHGWDAWNELRWNVHADGQVCYCPHTLARYRAWLDAKYGGLAGLNAAWKMRYTSWDDVAAGKMPRSPYTNMMAFEHFLTVRSNEHAVARYECLKRLDPDRPVTAHGAAPSPLHPGKAPDTALSRGNDWAFAERLDGVGTSSFPVWFGMDDANFAVRVGCSRSAARSGDDPAAGGRRVRLWLSELQGGRGAQGFEIQPSPRAAEQQRWIWTGLAEGADTILFWCWRDEIFGRESNGYGLAGGDGLAEERLEAMGASGAIVRAHDALLESYRMDDPEVGVLFSPQTYYLLWTDERPVNAPVEDLGGYCRALVRANVPYTVVDEEHLAALDRLKVLFLPRVLAGDARLTERLERFVRDGGTLVCESECCAYDPAGIWSIPQERFLARLTGVVEVGRRKLGRDSIEVALEGKRYRLPARGWLTPMTGGSGGALAHGPEGALVERVRLGKGAIMMCGTFFGSAYLAGSEAGDAAYGPSCDDFERFLAALVSECGVRSPVEVLKPPAPRSGHVHVRWGHSGSHRLCFVVTDQSGTVTLRLDEGFFAAPVRDLVSGGDVTVSRSRVGTTCQIAPARWGVAVLTDAPR
jgi:beta-galactosidase